jgi:predicted nucleotidyltransferase
MLYYCKVMIIQQSKSVSGQITLEGDFIEIQDGALFEVKGLIHPPNKLIAYPRYIPDKHGDRVRGDHRYRKTYPLNERHTLLLQQYPAFLIHDSILGMEVPQIPKTEIAVHYRPTDTLTSLLKKEILDDVESCAVEFISLIKDRSGVPSSSLGISGSVTLGLHTSASDIDIIVYGRRESMRVRDAMRRLLDEGNPVRHYRPSEMQRLYSFRVADTRMPYDQFARHEMRKTFQGMYQDREFFIRYVPHHSEISEAYGDVLYRSEGMVKIKALVDNASESLYTPCRYQLIQVDILEGSAVPTISEVVSFRGRFCEQADMGETVEMQGKLERVTTAAGSHHRVLLGGTPSDFMISLSLLNAQK